MTGQLPFLTEYSQQTASEIIALEGLYRTDSLVVTLEQAIGIKAWREGDAALSEAERLVLAIEALERDVNMDGYWQFFAGSSSEFVPWIVNALLRIGCPEAASITSRAMTSYGLSEAMSAQEIAGRAQEQDPDAHDDFELAYFGAGEDIAGRLFEFVKANRESIRIP